MKNKKEIKLPPFTEALFTSAIKASNSFSTPGHHGGQFFSTLPEGKRFIEIMAKEIFSLDISDSDHRLSDPSRHEGLTGEAEHLAAKAFGADRTFFVPHGTSVSNRIAMEALLTPGNLVLMDRGNHKSIYQGLIRSGATPMYIATERNESNILGGIDFRDLEEDKLRHRIATINPCLAQKERPFRLACLPLVTYDGLFRNIVDIFSAIAPLCEYVLFDAAWSGYESFLPNFEEYAPLSRHYNSKTPGILVTHSVHKQLAGFSQTSQLHKKDSHIKNQPYYLKDDILQHAFLSNISTSPFYPFLATLEMNAWIHEKAGTLLWQKTMKRAIESRKQVLTHCKHIKPFLPPTVHDTPWNSFATETIFASPEFFAIEKDSNWHGFHVPRNETLHIDPCKILLTTGEIYTPLLANYLKEQGFTPEKTDWNTILFLATPGDEEDKWNRLLQSLIIFEDSYEKNISLMKLIPSLPINSGCADYSHAMQKRMEEHHMPSLQQEVFSSTHLPPIRINPRKANETFLRGDVDYIHLTKAKGRIAAETILPYPPGICAIVPGEEWTDGLIDYLLALHDCARITPDVLHLVGIHHSEHGNDTTPYVYVLKDKS